MSVDRDMAMKFWQDVFGNVEWAKDCFGTWMCKKGYSDEEYPTRRPGLNEDYDYSWNVDHIRPKSDFNNETDADFYNNFEPMHRQNNLMKSDHYPQFKIESGDYKVFVCDICSDNGQKGYGIKDSNDKRIDWKGIQKRYYV